MSLYDINGNIISSGGSGSATDNSLLWNLTKWRGKHLVVDGNSLVQSTNWGQYTAEYLGMEYHNLGASGSNIVHGQTTMDGIKSLVADEFPEQADLIIIQGDSNVGDITDLDPSDQMDGENPKNTWSARTNYLMRCLKAKYPNVVIVLMADSVRYDSYRNGKLYMQNPPAPNILYEPNRNNYEAMKKIAEYNRHHFWSFDGDTPFNPTNYGNEYSNGSAAHNSKGEIIIGTHVDGTTYDGIYCWQVFQEQGNITPIMTANITGDYEAFASTEISEPRMAWCAFDNITGTDQEKDRWHSKLMGSSSEYIGMKFPGEVQVQSFSVKNAGNPHYGIKTFTLQGSIDGKTWSTYGTYTNPKDWGAETIYTVAEDVQQSRQYWRLNITDTHHVIGGTSKYCIIDEIKFYSNIPIGFVVSDDKNAYPSVGVGDNGKYYVMVGALG